MTFLRHSLTGVLLLGLTLGALAWAGAMVRDAVVASRQEEERRETAGAPAVEVEAVPLAPGAHRPVLEAFGEIRSTRTAELRAQTSGRILELSTAFRDGGAVDKGALIARLDPAAAEAEVAVARADLAEARAERRDAERALELARADLDVAREQAALREQALERRRDLDDRGVGSAAAVEDAALAAAAARAQVVASRQALASARSRIDQAETRVQRMRIALSEAERRLAETELRAPFAGRLAEVTASAGGVVGANERLARLIDPEALEVAFRLPVADHARLLDAEGRLRAVPVAARLDLGGLVLEAEGRLEREAAAIAEGQAGRPLYARLDAPGGLRPGDVVTVRVQAPAVEGVARLPARAVDAEGRLLVIGADDRLSQARLEIVHRQGDTVLVRPPGELAGARVVAARGPALAPGMAVAPQPVPPPEGVGTQAETEDLMELSPDRRAALIAYVEADSDLPPEDRSRVIALLSAPRVPASVVQRLERRMGG